MSDLEGLQVVALTFPQWHRSAVNDRLRAPGWTEWPILRGAVPWFAGHDQPRSPWLGELDEREPATWDRYCSLARNHGIDVLLWCTYWADGQPVLHEALDQGYLTSHGQLDMKFALLWTNQYEVADPLANEDLLAGKESVSGAYTRDDIWRSLVHLVSTYCHRETYWRIDGKPFLAIWDVRKVVDVLGFDGTKTLFARLREIATDLGLPGLHLHAQQASVEYFPRAAELGFDSAGLYNSLYAAWFSELRRRPQDIDVCPYAELAADVAEVVWPQHAATCTVPYYPNVNPGWDDSPRRQRTAQPTAEEPKNWRVWPRGLITVQESPEAFGRFVERGLDFLRQQDRPAGLPPVLLVGSLNEWTEGQYLLPDTRFRYGNLEALRTALGR